MENRPSSSKKMVFLLQPPKLALTEAKKLEIKKIYQATKEMNPANGINQLCKALSSVIGLPATAIYEIVKDETQESTKCVGVQVSNATNYTYKYIPIRFVENGYKQ